VLAQRAGIQLQMDLTSAAEAANFIGNQ